MARATVARPKSGSRAKKAKGTAPQIRTPRSAINYLDSLVNYERVTRASYTPANFNLSRMNRLLAALGHPQKKFKSVHLVGTKGKGSTAAMLSEMLRAGGLRVGTYTSPHVVDITERIAVDGVYIAERAFCRAVAAVAEILSKARVPEPTYFEVLTAAAFHYFAECDVKIAVVEAGLGARLDSTNVISPEVVGLTHVSLDHMDQLGSTMKAIAAEKAFAIKPGVPVVSVPQEPDVRDVFKRVADENESSIRFVDEQMDFSYRFEYSPAIGRHARICIRTSTSRFDHLHVPLMGAHQAANCGLALIILDELKKRGIAIDEQEAVRGLSRVRLPGRMEMISENPRVLIDGAHNAQSISALVRAIGQHIPYDSMIVIFGCHKDKDVRGMIRRIQLGADKIIFTSTGSSRSADPVDLAAEYTEACGKMAQVAPTLDDAMQIAGSAVSREDLICVTGSFHLVGAAKRKYTKVAVA